jgi:hypothetical protein
MDSKYTGLPIFNFEHLKIYHQLPEEFGPHSKLPETRTKKPAKEEFGRRTHCRAPLQQAHEEAGIPSLMGRIWTTV